MVKLNLQTIKQTIKQTVKQLFKKAERDGEDPWLALLDHRNTPTEGLGTSPAQRLMSRRTRTLIPTAASVLRPEIIPDSTEQLEWKRREAKFYHDRIAKQLPELEIGQEFRIAPLQKNQTWKQATCVEKLSDRSYMVKSGDQTHRRNRQLLRHAAEPITQGKQSNTDGTTLPCVNHKEVPTVPTWPATPLSPKPVRSAPASPTEHLFNTRSALSVSQMTRTRSTRLPSRFKDFDMKR